MLAKHHWLDAKVRVRFGETVPKDAAIQHAFCDYLFGTTSEVADLANLEGSVTLDVASGYRDFGSNGTPFLCVYDVDGAQTLALEVTNGTPEVTGGAGRPSIATDGDLQGMFSYSPGYRGTRLSKHLATEWMRQAVSLVRH